MKNYRQQRTSSHDCEKRRGIVLIVVLVLVVMVALAGFAFVGSTSTEYQAVKTSGASMQAKQTLASAEMLLRQFSQLSPAQQQLLGGPTNNPQLFRGVYLVDPTSGIDQLTETTQAEPGTDPQWQFTIVAGTSRSGQSASGLQYGVENESARLHLAAVLRWENDEPGSGREALLKLPDMTPQVADAILDWIDSDNEAREFGAEADDYRDASPPYSPRNAIPQSLDELLLVKSVTQQLLFGFDVNRNFYLDTNEELAMQSAGAQDSSTSTSDSNAFGWQRFLTVSSSESNRDANGNPRIDLNQSNLVDLSSQLNLFLPADVVTFILLYRQYGPVESSTSITSDTTGDTGPIATTFDPSVPPRIGFVTMAELIDATVSVPTPDGQATIYASPFRSDNETTREYLPILLSRTTAGRPNVGRINLNLASPSVLNAMPMLSEDTVGRIVEQRSSLTASTRLSVAWLLTEGILSPELFKVALPWLTTGGETVAGQIIVFRDSAGPFTRYEFIIDQASTPPRRIRWRNLNRRGIGFPLPVLKSEASATTGAAWTESI